MGIDRGRTIADLVHLMETHAPQAVEEVRKQFPAERDAITKAGAMGGPQVSALDTLSAGASRALCWAGARTIKQDVEPLLERARQRHRGAVRLKVAGALIALAASAGLVASTLSLIALDQHASALALSGVTFAGAAASTLAEFGAPKGANDPGSPLNTLISLYADAESLEFQLRSIDALGAQDGDFRFILWRLNECAYRLSDAALRAKLGG